MSANGWMSEEEAAEYLGLKKRGLQELLRRDKQARALLNPSKVHRYLTRYRRDNLDRFLEARAPYPQRDIRRIGRVL